MPPPAAICHTHCALATPPAAVPGLAGSASRALGCLTPACHGRVWACPSAAAWFAPSARASYDLPGIGEAVGGYTRGCRVQLQVVRAGLQTGPSGRALSPQSAEMVSDQHVDRPPRFDCTPALRLKLRVALRHATGKQVPDAGRRVHRRPGCRAGRSQKCATSW
eukprot:362822-Chlamydomonas_euryale.AAC.20